MYRTDLEISQIVRGGIILLSNGCPSPLHSPSLCRRHCPCVGGGCPCPSATPLPRDAAAPASGSPGRWGCPLRAPRYKRLCPRAAAAPVGWLQPAAPCAGGLGRSRLPLCRGALATAGCPLAGGQVVADRPLQIV
ncbi:hypothetical protein GW17_00028384 [Ensete ventricosum]|nr:hypothetical protein GW17_00028384 [Ensete ventricosum]